MGPIPTIVKCLILKCWHVCFVWCCQKHYTILLRLTFIHIIISTWEQSICTFWRCFGCLKKRLNVCVYVVVQEFVIFFILLLHDKQARSVPKFRLVSRYRPSYLALRTITLTCTDRGWRIIRWLYIHIHVCTYIYTYDLFVEQLQFGSQTRELSVISLAPIFFPPLVMQMQRWPSNNIQIY